MILFLIGFLSIIGGLIGWKVFDCDDGGLFFIVIGIAWLAIVLIAIPISLQDNNANIEEFKSVQASLLEARSNTSISEFELATIQKEVIEQNKWLANRKFHANLWLFRIFFQTKKINTLEPIK